MGKKKKKKVKVVYKDAPKKTARESFSEQVRKQQQQAKLDPEAQREATSRLVTLFKKLAEKPEPILDMFGRLEIPYVRRSFAFDDQTEESVYILIKVDDLHAGEIRHQEAGSIVNRLYGKKVDEQMPPNTHNPQTGEPLFVEPEVPAPEPAPEPLAVWEKELVKGPIEITEQEDYLKGIQG